MDIEVGTVVKLLTPDGLIVFKVMPNGGIHIIQMMSSVVKANCVLADEVQL